MGEDVGSRIFGDEVEKDNIDKSGRRFVMAEQREKTLSYSCLCPVDGTEREVELLYTSNNGGVFWKNRAVNAWCNEEAVCKESMGNPPRCPIFRAAPRVLPREETGEPEGMSSSEN